MLLLPLLICLALVHVDSFATISPCAPGRVGVGHATCQRARGGWCGEISAATVAWAGAKEGEEDASPTVLVIGGSGRVGGSTLRALHHLLPSDASYVVGGRSESNFERSRRRWESIDGISYDKVSFRRCCLTDHASLLKALEGVDVVVHTGGPFQKKESPEMLKAAIESGVSYVDVCDDSNLSEVAKGLCEEAQEAGVAATVSAGIWPGVDQLMAVEACNMLGGRENVETVNFNAFTAGTGNAGTTILSATFLILAEKALRFRNGVAERPAPATEFKRVDFGEGVGERLIFNMNFIETWTCHKCLGIPNVTTSFGTAPTAWNYLLKGMTLLGPSVLGNREAMQALAAFSEPLVRLVDMLVGATNAMRVDAVDRQGRTASLLYAHEDLEVCVGIATASFAAATLRGDVSPGVWYPEEAFSEPEARRRLLSQAVRGAFLWERQGPS